VAPGYRSRRALECAEKEEAVQRGPRRANETMKFTVTMTDPGTGEISLASFPQRGEGALTMREISSRNPTATRQSSK
jgi:hypothetical protein